jgi:hypothetical protein
MTSARPTRQTACVTEGCTSSGASDLTLRGSIYVDATTSGGDAIALKDSDRRSITGSSATCAESVAKQFQFPRPGNGWATVDYVP